MEGTGRHGRLELRREAWAAECISENPEILPHMRASSASLNPAPVARLACPSHLHLACFLLATLDKLVAFSQHISKPLGTFSELALDPFIGKADGKQIFSLRYL